MPFLKAEACLFWAGGWGTLGKGRSQFDPISGWPELGHAPFCYRETSFNCQCPHLPSPHARPPPHTHAATSVLLPCALLPPGTGSWCRDGFCVFFYIS